MAKSYAEMEKENQELTAKVVTLESAESARAEAVAECEKLKSTLETVELDLSDKSDKLGKIEEDFYKLGLQFTELSTKSEQDDMKPKTDADKKYKERVLGIMRSLASTANSQGEKAVMINREIGLLEKAGISC